MKHDVTTIVTLRKNGYTIVGDETLFGHRRKRDLIELIRILERNWSIALERCENQYKLLMQKEKYRWHDLRKNPEDLPKFVIMNQFHCYSEPVEVVSKNRIYDTALFIRNVENGNCNVGETYFSFNSNEDEYDQYGWNDITTEDVVAWRYIEPFEEVEE